jgi:hypothetical protein
LISKAHRRAREAGQSAAGQPRQLTFLPQPLGSSPGGFFFWVLEAGLKNKAAPGFMGTGGCFAPFHAGPDCEP